MLLRSFFYGNFNQEDIYFLQFYPLKNRNYSIIPTHCYYIYILYHGFIKTLNNAVSGIFHGWGTPRNKFLMLLRVFCKRIQVNMLLSRGCQWLSSSYSVWNLEWVVGGYVL